MIVNVIVVMTHVSDSDNGNEGVSDSSEADDDANQSWYGGSVASNMFSPNGCKLSHNKDLRIF